MSRHDIATVYALMEPLKANWPEIDWATNPRYKFSDGGNLNTGEIDQDYFDTVKLEVEIPNGMIVDSLSCSSKLLISERARNFFEKVVPGKAKYARITVNGLSYFLLLVTHRIDCLNYQQSVVRYLKLDPPPDPPVISRVEKYVFDKENIEKLDLFRIPNRPYDLISPELKSLLEQSGLTGFYFVDMEQPAPKDLQLVT